MQQTMQLQMRHLIKKISFGGKCVALVMSLAFLSSLVGCGSGAVSSPETPRVIVPLSVTPSTLTMSPQIPRTFVVAGGVPPYIIASSLPAVIAASPVVSASFTLSPRNVAVNTAVDIKVSDSASTTPVVASVTVQPAVFSVLPNSAITVAGPVGTQAGLAGTCPTAASPVKVVFFIFGGTPPYTAFSPLPLFAMIAPMGATDTAFTANIADCGTTQFIVTDKTGLVIQTPTVQASAGKVGVATSPTSPTFSATSSISIACGAGSSIALTGAGEFTSSPLISNNPSTTPGTVVYSPSGGTLPATVSVGVRSGTVNSPVQIEFVSNGVKASTFITVTGTVAGSCP